MKTVFFDIDSQRDFLYPAGALYVPNAERIVPAIAQLNRFAAAHGIPVVSTTDAHTENDPEFSVWPPHCVAGTWGQRKAEATLVDGASQIIVEKQTVDVFLAPDLVRVVDRDLLMVPRALVPAVQALIRDHSRPDRDTNADEGERSLYAGEFDEEDERR